MARSKKSKNVALKEVFDSEDLNIPVEEELLEDFKMYEEYEEESSASEIQSSEESEVSEEPSDVLEFVQSSIRVEPKALEGDPLDKVVVKFKPGLGSASVRTATLDLTFRKGEWPFVLEGGLSASLSRPFWVHVLQNSGCFELSENQDPELRRS